jgi:hypothetical protein
MEFPFRIFDSIARAESRSPKFFHGRVMAARKLGMTSVLVIELADLTPNQRRAYVQPNSRRLTQIASTWASLWVRGFYAYGTRSAIARIGWGGLSRYYHREAA